MKETPQYADISDAELKDLEDEFGYPLTRELALWFIRNRINPEAVARMTEQMDSKRAGRPQDQKANLYIKEAHLATKERCA